MADEKTTTSAAPAAAPAKPDPKGPPPKTTAAPPAPGAAKPPDAPAKPTPEERERLEQAKALARARRNEESLKTTTKRVSELENALREAQEGGAKERAELARLIREDPHAAFKALGADIRDITGALLKKAGKQDPKDAALDEMRRKIDELEGWRSKETERAKKAEAEAAESAERSVAQRIHANVTTVLEQVAKGWTEVAPSNDEERALAAGDELLLAELKDDPATWGARLKQYAQENPSHNIDDARKHYGAQLLQLVMKRAKLGLVGALLSGSQTDAPADEKGGRANGDAPRTLTRKLSAERASGTQDKPFDGLSIRERDEAKKAFRGLRASVERRR